MDRNRVLVITDESEDAKILCNTLAHAKDGPFTIQCVSTSFNGIEIVNQGNVDIILLDFFLPDSEGIATFDNLYNLFPTIPIKKILQ